MTNEPSEKPVPIMHSVSRMLDSALSDGAGLDTAIQVLSLLCLISILSRNQSGIAALPVTAPAGGAGVLQKVLGDLAKGDGANSDTLMSLLPLLNNPQIKSKLNPATIATVLGMLNTMGDKGAKHEPKAEKAEKPEDPIPPSAATVTSPEPLAEKPEAPAQEDGGDRRGVGRYLNWKSNF